MELLRYNNQTVRGVQTIQKETFHNLTSSACHPAERKYLEAEARLADDVRFLGLYLAGAPRAGPYFEQNTRTLNMNEF